MAKGDGGGFYLAFSGAGGRKERHRVYPNAWDSALATKPGMMFLFCFV